MVKSAPNLTFNPTLVSYGTIDTNSSCALKSYTIFNSKAGSSVAKAVNMSISFKNSTNSDEAEAESWVYYSTPEEAGYAGSYGVGPEIEAGSILENSSIVIRTKVKVPAAPTTSGTVRFQAHHRYQYTG